MSCKTHRVIINSFNFYLSEKVFISPSFARLLFQVKNSSVAGFYFINLNVSSHCLLLCSVSADLLICLCPYEKSLLHEEIFLYALKIISLPLSLDSFLQCVL